MLRRRGSAAILLRALLSSAILIVLPALTIRVASKGNFAGRTDRSLRYRPDGTDFVIENGAEFFNRPLYGTNTAFRVDAETTDWSSDGLLATAWIRYEFERAVDIDEVVIKFASWRSKAYPIRITVDDQVVFAGQTSPSLGYDTIKFHSVSGKSLRVELTGNVGNRDAFGNIVELAASPNPQSTAGGKTGQATLGIVEVEIYQPPIR